MPLLACAAPRAPALFAGRAAFQARSGSLSLRLGRPGGAGGGRAPLSRHQTRTASAASGEGPTGGDQPVGESAQASAGAGRPLEAGSDVTGEGELKTKECFKCKQKLPVHFKGHAQSHDGYARACRGCSGAYPPVTVEEKRCSTCEEVKPWHAFNRKRSSKDGLHHQCGACHTAAAQRNRQANAERNRRMGPSTDPQTCTGCGQTKLASDFKADLGSSTGLRPRCRQCEALAERSRKAKLPPVTPPETKVCSACGLELLSKSYAGTGSTGLSSYCKACDSQRSKERRARLPLLTPPETKVCGACALELPSTSFYADKNRTGLTSYCKACSSRQKEWRARKKAERAAAAAAAAAESDE